MPVIYEPKFRKDIQEGLHHRDPRFKRLVLMMCALSSRYSNDPRVFLPGQEEHSAGWKYFQQVHIMRDIMLEQPGIYELQTYCVSVGPTRMPIILQPSDYLQLAQQFVLVPQISWTLVTLGIRFCCEAGVHRKRPSGFPITIEEEERKRIFW